MTTARPFTYADAQRIADGEVLHAWYLNPDTDTYDPADVFVGKRTTSVRPTPIGTVIEAHVKTEYGNAYEVRLHTTAQVEDAAHSAWETERENDPEYDVEEPGVARSDLRIEVAADHPDAEEIATTPVAATSVNIVAFIDGLDDPDGALARIERVLREEFDGHTVRLRKAQARRAAEEYVDVVDAEGTLVAEHVLAAEASYVTPPRGRRLYNYPRV